MARKPRSFEVAIVARRPVGEREFHVPSIRMGSLRYATRETVFPVQKEHLAKWSGRSPQSGLWMHRIVRQPRLAFVF